MWRALPVPVASIPSKFLHELKISDILKPAVFRTKYSFQIVVFGGGIYTPQKQKQGNLGHSLALKPYLVVEKHKFSDSGSRRGEISSTENKPTQFQLNTCNTGEQEMN